MKISHRLILGIMMTVVLVGALGYICLYQFRKIAGPLNNEIPETVRVVSKASRLDGMAQFIRYYDEVLTQSARNYAFTQDEKWQQRYNEIAPKLDEIIKQAIESGDRKDKEFFSSVDKANLALVEMESESFELVNNGQAQKAVGILQGSAYRDQKNIYEQGLRNYISRKGAQYDETLEVSTSQIELANKKAQDIIKSSTLFIFIFIGGALILSAAIGISNYYSILMPIKKLQTAIVEIGAGHLETKIEIKSHNEIGELARNFGTMLTSLKEEKYKNETQDWLKTGVGRLNDKVRGEQKTVELAQKVVAEIVEYLDAQVGVIYLTEHGNTLKMVGSYAFTGRKGISNEFKFGEGLVGQAALERKSIMVTDVPDDYMPITSGTGQGTAKNIMVVPLLYEGSVTGAIEFGSFHEFSETQLEFLENCVENISIAINSANSRTQMADLLEQTQRQSEELQKQQEELKATNEELGKQTETLKRSEEHLKAQQEELEGANSELERKAEELENQKDQIITAKNEVDIKARELEVASKYKSEFLSNMSHELRTPLNSLLILSQMLADNSSGNLTDDQVQSAEVIYQSGSDLLSLINEILDLSKIEAGRMDLNIEKTDIAELEENIKTNFSHIAKGKGLELIVNVSDELPDTITTDTKRLLQVIKNFLSNAFKFTEEGNVTVAFQRPDENIDLSRSGLKHSDAMAIAVSDTGIGISQDKQKVIFEAFQQADGSTSRRYGGTGLGLSISRELAKFLNGEVQLTSEKGKGSTFTLYLPEILNQSAESSAVPFAPQLKDFKNDSSNKQSTADAPVVSEQQTVPDDRENIIAGDKVMLIIEDDPSFAKILADMSHEKEFKCLVANNGEMGMNLAIEFEPSAILLDIGLPDMSGMGVMEALKDNSQTRHIPIHFISAQDSDAISDAAYKKGAIGYLTKPVSREQLNDVFTTIQTFITNDIRRLLIAEDDENTRTCIMKLIDNDDIDITIAETGQKAYDLLKSEKFDCMILDLGLPDMSGFELLNQMKNDSSIATKPPVIVYTGKELSRQEDTELKEYAGTVIVKGVGSPERLLDETSLFLHRVEKSLPQEQQKMIRLVHDKDSVLSTKKVLIVDDDMRNVFALSHALKAKGMTVTTAENGQKALDILDTEQDIDVILMDIMMPVMDGYETMQKIRQDSRFWKLPILALTAKAMKGDKEKCIEAGASDYLTKPIDIEKVLSMLRVWLYLN